MSEETNRSEELRLGISKKLHEIFKGKTIYIKEIEEDINQYAQEQVKEALEELIGMNDRFPLHDILKKLIEASDILLHENNYDGHGWETISTCTDLAKEKLQILTNKKYHQSTSNN